MSAIPEMRPICIEEILNVLTECKEQLEQAYQESLIQDFWKASISANRVRDYLLYVLHKQACVDTIH